MKFKYLKHFSIPHFHNGVKWSISSCTGSLLREEINEYKSYIKPPKKVVDALHFCNFPYLCKTADNFDIDVSLEEINTLKSFNKVFSRIGNRRFYAIRLYSCFKNEIFSNTLEAIYHINNLSDNSWKKNQICLLRSFLASKVSKSFYKNGVIFIGAFLPTGDMHAWIIEDGLQPDTEDSGWINFRPLLAFYH